MSTGTTLYDYEQVEPLVAREVLPVTVNGGVVGYAGPSNREKNVIVVQKRRYANENNEQDYFRKYQAYNFDARALEATKDVGATLIAINEIDNDRIIEHHLSQFVDSDLANDREGFDDINYYVRVDDAIRTWGRNECTILKDH